MNSLGVMRCRQDEVIKIRYLHYKSGDLETKIYLPLLTVLHEEKIACKIVNVQASRQPTSRSVSI
jgi:hypothetical protein